MSTIPTTSKSKNLSYTVVGGTKGVPAGKVRGLSIVVLNRGGMVNRAEILEDLELLDVDEILSIEASGDSYAVESLAQRFPKVRFILLHREANPGEKINLGIGEAFGSLVAVLWNDMKILSSSFSDRFIEKARERSCLCVVPCLYNTRNEILPTLRVPAFHRNRLKVLPLSPAKDETPSLYPYDYCGLYSKERFVLLGGYDSHLGNPYWQKLDFGFRAHLWGETILSASQFRISSYEASPPEDSTPDECYRIFFLKNLAVRFLGDRGELPSSKFLPFVIRAGGDFLSAVKEFREVRKWVELNAYRFRMDGKSVTELWEDPEA